MPRFSPAVDLPPTLRGVSANPAPRLTPRTMRGQAGTGTPEAAKFPCEINLNGGDGGIRTLDTAFQPYNGLANRRLQPLGHVSTARQYARQRSPIKDNIGKVAARRRARGRAPGFFCCRNARRADSNRLRRSEFVSARLWRSFVKGMLIPGAVSCQICNMDLKTGALRASKPLSRLRTVRAWLRFQWRNAGCPADRVHRSVAQGWVSSWSGEQISRGIGTDLAQARN
jgi:hypothetical protein